MHSGGPDLPMPDDAATARLERPPTFPPTSVGPGPRAENEARLGRRIGPYRLQRLLGHGGMGAVYLATRADGEFEREVALKLIRIGGEDELSVRRFERERRILSRLEHPAIARLYDGGVDAQTGAPWFAMERIEGESLAKWCAARQLPLHERVRLVMAIGQAVQYAHQQLVIHRDLKPSNILVDAAGAPHVLDFGIAALLDESEADRTSPRTAIHTPEYAAPEQIEGAPISAATDVYTLGVILFELLTGERPFDAEGRSAFELQRAVLEAPTPALTTRLPGDPERLAQQAAERAATPAQWRRVLRGDLDAIVQRALEKQPQRRYPSMAALVDDLQAWLDGRPVRAARAGWLYRSGKFARRHRLALATVASVFALLAVATGLSLVQARKARLEAERAEASKQFLASLFQQARPGEGGDALSAQQLLDEGRVRLEQEMQGQPRLAGELLNTIGNAYAHLGDYAQARSQLERALLQLPAEGETLRPRFDVLVDLVDLCSHQDRREEGERYAAEALQLLARLREAAASPLAWLRGGDGASATYYFGDAAQTLDSRAEDLDLARARLMDLRGASAEAIALREAVAQARDTRPNEHPTRIRVAQNDLALALMVASRYEEAVARFERLLRDNEREHGPGHASSIFVRHNLALTLRRLDRLDAAERIERDNLAVVERALPASHPMQAYVANTLASILRQQGRYAEAQPLYVRARAVFDGQPEADPGMLATVHLTESQNRLAMFDADGAAASLDAAERTWSEAFGAEYPRRASVALQRAALALHRGEADAAGDALQAADALLAANAGVDPRDRPRRVLLGAEWRRLRGEPELGAQELDDAWPQWQQTWPAPHVEQVAWALARAQLALDRAELDLAQQHLTLAQEQQTRRHAAELPELRLLEARLACAQRRFEACAAAAERAEAGFAAYLPAEAWPRRLARAWGACGSSRAIQLAPDAAAPHQLDVAALEAACRR